MLPLLDHILSLPRDTGLIVECNPALAAKLWEVGLHVVHIGPPVNGIPSAANANELQTNWSRLLRRVPNVAVLGSDEALLEVADRMRFQTEVNCTTTMHRAKGWVSYMLQNMRHLVSPTAMEFRGLRNVPCFIVGCGSSLDRNHHLLEKAKRKGIVLAVNGANRSVAAHIAVTIESNDLRHKLGQLSDETIRAFGSVGHPDVMTHGNGKLAMSYCGELSKLIEPLTGVPRIISSATGGAAALGLAERWGCDPIVLVGQDFALEDGGRIYPECVGLGESRVHREGDVWHYGWDPVLRKQPRHNPLTQNDTVHELPAIGGGMVTTSSFLGNQTLWYAQVANKLGRERLLINASEWGAVLPGWQHGNLAEVLKELPDADVTLEMPAEGIAIDEIREWFERNIDGASDAARAAKRRDAAALRKAVRATPLVEAWCYPETQEAMAERRQTMPSPYRADEYRAAKRTINRLCERVAAGAEELAGVLEGAKP